MQLNPGLSSVLGDQMIGLRFSKEWNQWSPIDNPISCGLPTVVESCPDGGCVFVWITNMRSLNGVNSALENPRTVNFPVS